MVSHARIQKVLSEGSNSDMFFFVFFLRGARLQRPQKAGNYWPASETPLKWRTGETLYIEMAFRLRADNGPPLNADLAAL